MLIGNLHEDVGNDLGPWTHIISITSIQVIMGILANSYYSLNPLDIVASSHHFALCVICGFNWFSLSCFYDIIVGCLYYVFVCYEHMICA
jgi:hypothetical protein